MSKSYVRVVIKVCVNALSSFRSIKPRRKWNLKKISPEREALDTEWPKLFNTLVKIKSWMTSHGHVCESTYTLLRLNLPQSSYLKIKKKKKEKENSFEMCNEQFLVLDECATCLPERCYLKWSVVEEWEKSGQFFEANESTKAALHIVFGKRKYF